MTFISINKSMGYIQATEEGSMVKIYLTNVQWHYL